MKLCIGIHRGTLTSRDTEEMNVQSSQQATEELDKAIKGYARFGYQLWFAELRDDGGKRVWYQNGTNP
mgnify:CR=1 FL=1